jgi:DNA repair protein RadD
MLPRDYQQACHDATWRFLHAHPTKNPLVIMPTGTGKSLQMALLIWHLKTTYPHLRILSLAHVQELVQGNYRELVLSWPSSPAGVYSAGLGVKDHRQDITFCGIQSVAKKAPLFKRVDFVLVDEAHAISDNDTSNYVTFIEGLRKTNPNLIVIGYTATAFRMGMGSLTDGKLFDEIAFDLSDGEAFVWLIENGYLIRPVPKDPGFQLDSDGISINAGEFDTAQTSQALRDQDILERAVDTCIQLGVAQGRKAWLHFCQSIEDAELVADMFTYKGYPHEAVHSRRGDREEVLAAFQRGELQGVTNKDILTTGYNQKNIDLIGALRLTRSPGLWVQMVGRGTRPDYKQGYDLSTREGREHAILASAKQTCLVLDFVRNTERLGPINYPRLPKRKGAKGDSSPVVRKCPECNTYTHASRKFCDECGYEFPPPERLNDKPGSGELVATKGVIDLTKQPDPKEFGVFGVHRMIAMHHEGRGGKVDTMRVDYFCGVRRFSTWVCFAHPEKSFPRQQAERWWKMHGGQGEAPTDIEDAVARVTELNKPKFIKVWVNTKYPEIDAYDFRGTRFELPPELGGPPLADPGPDPLEALEPQGGPWYEADDEIPF